MEGTGRERRQVALGCSIPVPLCTLRHRGSDPEGFLPGPVGHGLRGWLPAGSSGPQPSSPSQGGGGLGRQLPRGNETIPEYHSPLKGTKALWTNDPGLDQER